MKFGDRLAAQRKLKGKSQTWLGEGLGEEGKDVGKPVVLGWEKNRHFPKVDQLALICKKLDCSADYLLFGSASDLSPTALSIAKWFDELKDPQFRDAAESGAMAAINAVRYARDLRPIVEQQSDHEVGKRPAKSRPPAPAGEPTPAKTRIGAARPPRKQER